MASVEFRQVPIDQLAAMPEQAYIYLDDACRQLKDLMTVKMAVDGVIAGLGAMFLVFADNVLTGCMYIDFKLNHVGKTMNIVLLGGVKFKDWFADLRFFLMRLALDRDVNECTILGRKGWEKLLPDMEFLGVLLRKKIK